MTRDELLEDMALRVAQGRGRVYANTGDIREMDRALQALETAIPGLSGLLAGTHVVVPREATAEMNGRGETVLMDYLTKRREFMSVSDIYRAMIEAQEASDDRK